MYGFIGTWKWKNAKYDLSYKNFQSQSINNNFIYEDFFLLQKTNGKFQNDKICFENDNIIFCIDGLIYNLKSLVQNQSSYQCIADMYETYGVSFIDKLDGVFSLVLFDKKKKLLILGTDHTAMKSVYYYDDNRKLIFSTDIAWLYNTIRESGKKLSLNIDGAYSLLSYGYMIDDMTLISGVKKLLPGEYLVCQEQKFSLHNYFNYSEIKFIKDDYNCLLEEAEKLFSNAVQKRYKKDDEYDYKHICTLSGGLDSRSILFTSFDLGYKEQLTITMSQSNTLDEKIAKNIATSLGVKNLFLVLNNGEYLRNVERAVELNGGLVTYQGLMHSELLFSLVNHQHYGAIHSGEIGDAIFGGHAIDEYQSEVDYKYGAFSSRLISRISPSILEGAKNRCNTKYMFFLLERGLNSTINGWYSATPYTEYTSAFLDKAFLKFILSVPPEYRAKSRFYIDWMREYHSEMCHFLWEKNNAYPTAGKVRKAIGIGKKLFRKKILHYPENMNPYDLWMNNNNLLRDYYEQYFSKAINLIGNMELRKDMKDLFQQGGFSEKSQILTLLGAVTVFQIET